jgi:putative acetyltransferase
MTDIRPERVGDHRAIRDVVAAAFQSDAEADLVERIRASENFVPELSLVADDEGEIVGHVMLSYVSLVDGSARRRILSLAPLAVAPDRHKTGIGSALVREATERADDRGEPLVILEGSPVYYSRFGFEPCSNHGIELTVPDWAPPEAAQVLRLKSYDPAVRGRVVYPAAFEGLS